MSKPKLLQILENLPLEVLKKFNVFFKRNYPKRQVDQDILEALLKVYPRYGHSKADLAALYAKVFPPHFKGKRFSNALGKLLPPLEDFLVLEKLNANKQEKAHLLSSIYLEHGIKDLFFTRLQDSEKILEEEKAKDVWFWLKKLQIVYDRQFNPYTIHERCGPENVLLGKEYLEHFWTAAQLQYSCELYSRHKVLAEEAPDLSLIEQLDFPKDHENFLYHQSYLLLLELMQEENDEAYFKLKQKIIIELHQFKPLDQFILITYLLNYVAKRILQGQQSFLQEQFDILKAAIPNRVFITFDVFDNHHFINAVDTGGNLKKFAWVETIIKDWIPFIKKDIREETQTLANAILLFYKKEFGQVIATLRTFRSKLVQYETRGRFLRLMSNYELKEDMESILPAYEKYIQRRKDISEDRKKAALNVSKMVLKMQKANPNKQALLEELSATEHIYLKKWLEAKIKALK